MAQDEEALLVPVPVRERGGEGERRGEGEEESGLENMFGERRTRRDEMRRGESGRVEEVRTEEQGGRGRGEDNKSVGDDDGGRSRLFFSLSLRSDVQCTHL